MALILHIAIALTSLLYTGFVYMYPSKTKLRIAYALVLSTSISGFLLVVSKPANLTRTCMSGLVYLGLISWAISSAHNKLKLETKAVEQS